MIVLGPPDKNTNIAQDETENDELWPLGSRESNGVAIKNTKKAIFRRLDPLCIGIHERFLTAQR